MSATDQCLGPHCSGGPEGCLGGRAQGIWGSAAQGFMELPGSHRPPPGQSLPRGHSGVWGRAAGMGVGILLCRPCCTLHTGPLLGGGWCRSTICGKFCGETDRQSTQKHNPDRNKPTFPVSVFQGKILFPSPLFRLKLRRKLMHGSISVRLFGERQRDQNKPDNKRPLPAGPWLSGALSAGTKARRCVLCHSASDLALQPSSALKGQASLSSSSYCTRDRAGWRDLPEDGIQGPLF